MTGSLLLNLSIALPCLLIAVFCWRQAWKRHNRRGVSFLQSAAILLAGIALIDLLLPLPLYPQSSALIVHALVACFAWSLLITNKTAEMMIEKESSRYRALIATQARVDAAHDDETKILQAIVEGCRTGFPNASGAVIEALDGNDLVYEVVSGTNADHIGLRLAVTGSLSGCCVRQGEALLCRDTETDPRVNREKCRQVGIRSMMVIPVFRHGKVLRVLKLHAAKPESFTEQDLLAAQLMVGVMLSGFSGIGETAAQKASLRKREFLLNMSHELRSPLHNIVTASNMGLEGILGEMSDKQYEILRLIRENANHLL